MYLRRDERDQGRRILVAEDDPATLALLKRQLMRAGYEVLACENGREALDLLVEEGADIVVADWMMPEMTGIELCRAITKMRDTEAMGALYVVLLTASIEKAGVVEALEAGADDFLRKPYDLQELLARIRAGQRILRLQDELVQRQLQLCKFNAEMAMLNRKLTKQANTDALTGLRNRRSLFDYIGDAWALAKRREHPLSCTMVDVDRFKNVNDTYGHEVGDLVLQQIGERINQQVRSCDVSGRFGGEEFLIVCAGEPVQGAARLAERLRHAVAERAVDAGGTSIPITISVGVAAMRAAHTSPEVLIADADAMLYAAKANGRNQVWLMDSEGHGYRFELPVAESTSTGRPDG